MTFHQTAAYNGYASSSSSYGPRACSYDELGRLDGASGYDDGTEDDDSGCQTAVISGGPSGAHFDLFSPPATQRQQPRNTGSGSWGSNSNARRRASAVDAMIAGTPVTGGLCQMFGASRLESGKSHESSPSTATPSTPMPPSDQDFRDLMSGEAQTPMPGFCNGFSGVGGGGGSSGGGGGLPGTAARPVSAYLCVDLSQNRLYQKRMSRVRRSGSLPLTTNQS
jgi:hypothetical protein